MSVPAERTMPVVDVYWDEGRARWTFEDASGYAPVDAVDVESATRLVRAHFPGSAIRWIGPRASGPGRPDLARELGSAASRDEDGQPRALAPGPSLGPRPAPSPGGGTLRRY